MLYDSLVINTSGTELDAIFSIELLVGYPIVELELVICCKLNNAGPLLPVGPVVPVGPVDPLGPSIPVGPVDPVDPVVPV